MTEREAGMETSEAVGPSPGDAGGTPWLRYALGLTLGAILLRLVLLLGRGDYIAFDEGWYLLLARSLYTGEGYQLVGLPHVTLSPLYPILAGAAGVLLDSWVWGGRVVAAVASGLLVLPVWDVFRRLGSERTALLTAALVAVLPSMAPFVVPFWIGADLWVGAEPLLHLLLFSALAAWLRADRTDSPGWWAATGTLFGAGFLARPEAILTWGFLGLVSLGWAARRRSGGRRLAGIVLMGVGFVVVAAPYWVYIHGATGRWSLTGREVASASAVLQSVSGEGTTAPAGAIERMLWEDDTAYQERLYGLDPSGLRLRSGYWGVQPPVPLDTVGTGAVRAPVPSPEQPDRAVADSRPEPPSRPALFGRALAGAIPLLMWPFVLVGLFRAREPGRVGRELAVAGALVGTSLAIAFVVAIDTRTQLFLVPLLAWYAARGFAVLDEVVRDRGGGAELRPWFLETLLAAAAVAWLLGINGQRLYRSLTLGSPHHVVAEQNRAVAEELDTLTGGDEGPVASWHPALAVYADRPWRVLPFAPLPDILRYEVSAGATVVVLSAYYPPPLNVEALGTRYLILPVPSRDRLAPAWRVQLQRGDSIRAVGSLRPMDRPDP